MPLQFRLQTLFAAVTVSAIVLWLLFESRFAPVAIYVAYFLLPPVAISGIVFHRGYHQAFFIGMAPWAVFVAIWTAATRSPPVGLTAITADFLDVTRGDPYSIMQIKIYLTFPFLIA